MRIFGPLPWPTISPVTVTFASAAASLVTVSPSTSRIAGRATVSPAAPASRLILNVSPTATLCWLPPAFTTAYTTDSSIASFMSSFSSGAHDRSERRVLDGLRTPSGRHRTVPAPWRCNPTSVPELSWPVDVTPTAPSGGRARGPAGPPATPRPRRDTGGLAVRDDVRLG